MVTACRTDGKFAGAGGAGNEWDFMLAAARQRSGMLRELQFG